MHCGSLTHPRPTHAPTAPLQTADIQTNQLVVDVVRSAARAPATQPTSSAVSGGTSTTTAGGSGHGGSAAALQRAASCASDFAAAAASALAARRLPGQVGTDGWWVGGLCSALRQPTNAPPSSTPLLHHPKQVWTAHAHKATKQPAASASEGGGGGGPTVHIRRKSPVHSEDDCGDDEDWSPTARGGSGRGGRGAGAGAPLPVRRKLEAPLPAKAHLWAALASTDSNSDEASAALGCAGVKMPGLVSAGAGLQR